MSYVEVNLVTYFNSLNIIRREVASNHSHIYVDDIPFTNNFRFAITFHYVWMFIVFQRVIFHRFRSNFFSTYTLSIMRLSYGWEI